MVSSSFFANAKPDARPKAPFGNAPRLWLLIAAHPTHPLAKKRKVPLADLAGERLIAYSQAEYPEYHEFLKLLFVGRKRGRLVAEEHDSVTSLIAAVESSRGVAMIGRQKP